MPDEATPAPVEEQETPAVAAPEEGKPAEETAVTDNWEQRYNDLRPEFDRRNALLTAAEGQQGPEAQAQALRQLGVEVEMAEEEEQEEDDPFEDPAERLEKRLQAQEERLNQREEQEQEAHFQKMEEDFIEKTLDEIAGKEGVKLSARETKVIANNALANRLENGEPDLQGAFDDLKGIKSEAAEQYRQSKDSPAAPVGSAGEDKIDFSNPDARRKFMREDLEARQRAEEES